MIRSLSKAGYKINLEKAEAFLYQQETKEEGIQGDHPIHNSLKKKKKNPWNKPTKDTKDLYNENFKSLKKEI